MAFNGGKYVLVLLFALLVLFSGFCPVSAASSPAKLVNGFLSNAFSLLMKWAFSLKTTSKTVLNRRPAMKFENGYNVETVFDGSKLGIEPHSVEVLPDGDLLILDSENCNLYKISSSLSVYSRPRMVSGSADGLCGYVDGKLRDARMNHPKGLTTDDRGNVYVADTENMAIRKISDTVVTTIAGGKRDRGGRHVDGPSEDAKFSNDFDLVYLGSSCSLLVIDRGSKAIREIQLRFDDCAHQYGNSFPIGVAVLFAAGFFGYMLALLQQRISLIVSSQKGLVRNEETIKQNVTLSSYQSPFKQSTRHQLIQNEHDPEKHGRSLMGTLGKLAAQTAHEILRGFHPLLKNKATSHPDTWPAQESFMIPDEDEPPSIEPRTPTPSKTYAFMAKDSEKMQHLRQSTALYSRWDGELAKQKTSKRHLQHHLQYFSSPSETYYEHQHSEETKEIIFGAVQEQDRHGTNVVIEPLDHGTPFHGFL